MSDVLVIGAGPAGLYAAYYAGFRGFSVTVLDVLTEPGGQITAMYPEKEIFDIAGFPAVKGRDLVDGLMKQAGAFNPTFILGERAEELETSEAGPVRVVTDKGTVIEAKVVIITGGIGSFTPRELPAGNEYVGKGLVYFVPKLKSVTLVHRRDTFRAHAATVDQVRAMGVELIINSEVESVAGDDWIESVTIKNKEGESRTLPAQTLVAALGFIANIGPIANWGIELEKRRILVDTTMKTNLPRVYSAGDITTYVGKVPLISVGFGEAGLAVNNSVPYIDEHQGVFPGHSSGGGE